MGRGTWGLAAAFALAACVVKDPNHCANRERDATCQELGLGDYCSACAATNNGCVPQRPEDACYPDGAATASSTGTTSIAESGSDGSEDASSSGPPPMCDVDDDCPGGNPYCIGGTCGTCDQAPEGFCGDRGGGTPVCHEAWGRCVECTEIADEACVEPNAWCGPDFTCGGCLIHEQCPGSACDLSRGTCLPNDMVFHVDNDECGGGSMVGTSSDPFCTIPEAISEIPAGGRGTVIVRKGSNYTVGIKTQNSRTVAVLGQQFPNIIAADDEGAWVSAGDRLFISGAQVRSTGEVGVRCDGGSQLWLDNVLVDNNATGIVAGPCDLHVRRSEIIFNEEVGVQLDDATMRMTSSTVVGNSRAGAWPAIEATTSTFEIVYSTVVADTDRTIECSGGMGGPVRNSVIVSSALDSLDCPWAAVSYTVHDGGDADLGEGNVKVGTFDPDWFTDLDGLDVHVAGSASSPFNAVARWEAGDPIRDFDGERRETTPGVMNFAGADEP